MPRATCKTHERQSLTDLTFDLSRYSSLTLTFVDKRGAELFNYRASVSTQNTDDSQGVTAVDGRKGRPQMMLIVPQTNRLNAQGQSHTERIPVYYENGKRRSLTSPS